MQLPCDAEPSPNDGRKAAGFTSCLANCKNPEPISCQSSSGQVAEYDQMERRLPYSKLVAYTTRTNCLCRAHSCKLSFEDGGSALISSQARKATCSKGAATLIQANIRMLLARVAEQRRVESQTRSTDALRLKFSFTRRILLGLLLRYVCPASESGNLLKLYRLLPQGLSATRVSPDIRAVCAIPTYLLCH